MTGRGPGRCRHRAPALLHAGDPARAALVPPRAGCARRLHGLGRRSLRLDGRLGGPARHWSIPTRRPSFIVDPGSVYADGGTNWGQLLHRRRGRWRDAVHRPDRCQQPSGRRRSTILSGSWLHRLCLARDLGRSPDADSDRIPVGHAWLESEAPRRALLPDALCRAGRAVHGRRHASIGPARNAMSGTLGPPFSTVAGRTIRFWRSNETDVEYAWAPGLSRGAFRSRGRLPGGGRQDEAAGRRWSSRSMACALWPGGGAGPRRNAVAGLSGPPPASNTGRSTVPDPSFPQRAARAARSHLVGDAGAAVDRPRSRWST